MGTIGPEKAPRMHPPAFVMTSKEVETFLLDNKDAILAFLKSYERHQIKQESKLESTHLHFLSLRTRRTLLPYPPVNNMPRDRSSSRSRSRSRSPSRGLFDRSRSGSRDSNDAVPSRRSPDDSRRKKRSSRRSRTRSRSLSSGPRTRRSHSRTPPHATRSPPRRSDRRRESYSSYRRSRSRSPRRFVSRFRDGRDNAEPCRCIGVFGMSLDTSERYLDEVFRKFGEVESVKIVRDHITGRSRGFAFIYFTKTRYAERAKKGMEDVMLDGSTVRVDYSVTSGPRSYTSYRIRPQIQIQRLGIFLRPIHGGV